MNGSGYGSSKAQSPPNAVLSPITMVLLAGILAAVGWNLMTTIALKSTLDVSVNNQNTISNLAVQNSRTMQDHLRDPIHETIEARQNRIRAMLTEEREHSEQTMRNMLQPTQEDIREMRQMLREMQNQRTRTGN